MHPSFLVIGPAASGKATVSDVFSEFGYMAVTRIPYLALERTLEAVLEKTPPSSGDGENALPAVFSPSLTLSDALESPDQLLESLAALLRQYPHLKILALDAPETTLLQRFQESEKKHPLETNGDKAADGLQAAIRLEKPFFDRLTGLKAMFPERYYAIETHNLPPRELYAKTAKILGIPVEATAFTVYINSFGYKHGVPSDSDLVFDMRFLDNPFYVEALRPLTGLDQPVIDHIFSVPEAAVFVSQWTALIKTILPLFKAQGKMRVAIAVGCTGGQHRSVCMTEILGKSLKESYPGYNVVIRHREQFKWPGASGKTMSGLHPS